MNRGTTNDAIHGRIRLETSGTVVMLPLIQSIIVVISPIGDHAPPLLAAMIMILEKIHLSAGLAIIFKLHLDIGF